MATFSVAWRAMTVSSGISAVTWHELAFGVRSLPKGVRRTALEVRLRDLASDLPAPLPFTGEAADWLASERARLEAKGVSISIEDGVIAATAYLANLTVVTANTKHFSRQLVAPVRTLASFTHVRGRFRAARRGRQFLVTTVLWLPETLPAAS